MFSRVASGSVAVTAATAFTRFITSATNLQPGNNLVNQGGMYGLLWSCVATSTAVAGSAEVVFTWRDPDINVGITATGGVAGMLFNAGSTANVLGTGITSFAISGASGYQQGFQWFMAGSGASGASAYLQYAVTGNSGSCAYRLDYQLFRVEDWGV